MPLAGRPLVGWSIAAFRACESVGAIVVACPPGHDHGLGLGETRLEVVDGGATRAESVSNALAAVDTELVAIHDAARPLVTAELIEDVVALLLADEAAAGAIAAAPVTDTIKHAGEGRGGPEASSPSRRSPFPISEMQNGGLVVRTTIPRDELWAAQTPQVFRTEALRRALDVDAEEVAAATDEAMLVEAAGGKVLIHPSPPENLKVTTPLDLELAELLLAERDV